MWKGIVDDLEGKIRVFCRIWCVTWFIIAKNVVYDDIYDENSVINYLCACSVGKTWVLWCVNA